MGHTFFEFPCNHSGKMIRVKVSAAAADFGSADYDAPCPLCPERFRVPSKPLESEYSDNERYTCVVERENKRYRIIAEKMNMSHPDEAKVHVYEDLKPDPSLELGRLLDEELPKAILKARAFIGI